MTRSASPPDDATSRIERIEEILDYQNPWIKLYFDRVRFPGGREGRYTRIGEGEGGVVVLPLTADGRLAMIRIYRYPIDSWQWEVPRGFAHPGLSAEENAAKELKEELGITPAALAPIGAIYPNSGILASLVSVFVAVDVPEDPGAEVDKSEGITRIAYFSPREVGDMIREGLLRDAFTLTAIVLAEIHGYWRWE